MVVVGEVSVEEDPMEDEDNVGGDDHVHDGDDDGGDEHDDNTSLWAVWLMFDGSGLTWKSEEKHQLLSFKAQV